MGNPLYFVRHLSPYLPVETLIVIFHFGGFYVTYIEYMSMKRTKIPKSLFEFGDIFAHE